MKGLKFLLLSLLALTYFLTACSGGSASNSDGGIEGTGAPVASAGAISSFGSVFVNGIEFETNTSNIIIDDEGSQPESALQVGMLVLVRGTLDDSGTTGSAISITFETRLQGPATAVSIDGDSGSLTILGVEVIVTEETVIDADTLSSLSDGQVLSVSGFTFDNSIVATRIDLISNSYSNGDRLEIDGTIAEVDSANSRFRLNTLWVDFSSANILPASISSLEPGLLVDVRGSGFDSHDRLQAIRVKVKNGEFDFESGDSIELEGIVSDFVSNAEFELAGTPVNALNATFNKGSATDIANGIHLEVEGIIDTDGILQATTVAIKKSPSVRLRGSAQSIDVDNGTLNILGASITADSSTFLKDVSDEHVRYFSLEDINSGDWIEVRGTVSDSTIDAISLTRRKTNVPARIKGAISEIAGATVVVLGIEIDLSGLSTGAELVPGLNVGDIIDTTGEETGSNSLAAATLSLEDD